jgi:hypothetical protein
MKYVASDPIVPAVDVNDCGAGGSQGAQGRCERASNVAYKRGGQSCEGGDRRRRVVLRSKCTAGRVCLGDVLYGCRPGRNGVPEELTCGSSVTR